jgi:hypothetical protein
MTIVAGCLCILVLIPMVIAFIEFYPDWADSSAPKSVHTPQDWSIFYGMMALVALVLVLSICYSLIGYGTCHSPYGGIACGEAGFFFITVPSLLILIGVVAITALVYGLFSYPNSPGLFYDNVSTGLGLLFLFIVFIAIIVLFVVLALPGE